MYQFCDLAQLLRFIRGVTQNSMVCEGLLSTESLKNSARECYLFSAVEHAFSSNNINWDNLRKLTTDGVSSMIGYKQGYLH